MTDWKIKYLLLSGLVFFTSLSSLACGAFERDEDEGWLTIYKYHFYQGDIIGSYSDLQRSENIRLWKGLTTYSLPDSVIEEGVYQIPFDSLKTALETGKTPNRFIRWIHDNRATDLKDFLLLAKELEELRHNRVSAWYYPSDKSGFDKATDEKNKFETIIGKCKSNKTGRLADRYALQGIRALLSIGEYQECVDYFNQTLKRYPDSNLFKRMAQGYIAGCYTRLGDKKKADAIFARLGDFVSISNEERLEILAKENPESELFKAKLNHYIGYGDSLDNMRYYRLADIALKSRMTVHRGDWLYLKAYIEHIYRHDTKAALKYARQALANSFSDLRMRDDARFFKICLTPYNDNTLPDIKWMLDRCDAGKWEQLIPGLLKKHELTKALLLANYDTTPDSLRYDYKGSDWHTWANSGFQMLLSYKADDIVRYKNELTNPTMGLTSMLKPNIRHDSDYLNEIIGTLYLREGKYDLAARYLSTVSFGYQVTMNIFKGEYLSYNPWGYYYTKADPWDHPWHNYSHYYDDEEESEGYYRPNVAKSKVSYLQSQINAKLNFAKEMSRLEKIIASDNDTDTRAMARLKYAIGRYNSLNTCWALTQYWLGATNQCYYYYHGYYSETRDEDPDFIISTPRELKGLDDWFENEVQQALNDISNRETLADAHLILRNYRTLAKHFPDTRAGQEIASQCDAWVDWL